MKLPYPFFEWLLGWVNCVPLSKYTRLLHLAHLAEEERRQAWQKCGELRSQLMNLRAGQSTDAQRAGWEVAGYIPEEVLTKFRTSSPHFQEEFIRNVAYVLVGRALAGLVRVQSCGRVNALVFAPRSLRDHPDAPRSVSVLFDDAGHYKMDSGSWDQRTTEQKIRGY